MSIRNKAHLTSLLPYFQRTLQEVPAIYGLIWATPRVLFDLLLNRASKALKNKSIAQLFPKMVEDENLDVVFNFDVVSIKRKCFDRVEVESFDKNVMEFDFLFWSGPPSDFQKVAHVRCHDQRKKIIFFSIKFFYFSFLSCPNHMKKSSLHLLIHLWHPQLWMQEI